MNTTSATATGAARPTIVGSDFVNRTQTLLFSGSTVVKMFTVTLLPDAVNESDETFSVTIGVPQGYQLNGSATETIRIVDDD